MKFDIGKFQKGMDMATGLAGLLTSTIQKGAEMADLPENNIQEEIDDLRYSPSNSGSYNELLNKFNSTNWAKTNYIADDLMGISPGEAAGKTILGALDGGISGAEFGTGIAPGIGTGIGFGVGTLIDGLAGIFGYVDRKRKATAAAQKYNHEGAIANQIKMNNMQENAINIGKDIHNTGLLYRAAYGGPLYINDVFTNGVRKIENGGSHSENPLGGVPMGIAADGLENLVEEGELIYKDYVFSQRLKVPEASKAILGLSKKKDYTFAEAADELQKESEERPNDPISKRTLDEMMGRLQESQETVKAKKETKRLRDAYNKLSPLDKLNLAFAMQQPQEGQMANGGMLAHKHAGLFSKSYLDSLPIGEYYTGTNWADRYAEQEAAARMQSINDWANNEGIIFNPNILSPVGLPPTISVKRENPKDPNSARVLPTYQEVADQAIIDAIQKDNDKRMPGVRKSTAKEKQETALYGNPFAQALRASSVFGSLAGAVGSLFDKPNYSNIERAERAMAAVPRVSSGHVGQRLAFNPIDINYLMTQTANQGIGTRRALVESGAGPQSLIASNYATQTAMGQNLLAALKENNARRLQALEFNRGTDATNIGNDLNAALANQRRDMMGANFLLETAPMRNAELATVQNNRSVQLTDASNQLHNLGTDMMNRDMAIAMAQSYGVPYNPYMLQAMGTLGYRQSKEGGKLNTKKEGGKDA